MIGHHRYSDLSRRAYTGVRVPSGNNIKTIKRE
nr:MAG TPA: hypothetical protein [Caudoviricetes sp.]